MGKISFQTLWKVIKIIAIIQILNAFADYLMWVFYGYLVPSWALATLSVGYIVVIFALKKALVDEKCAKVKDSLTV